MDIDALWFDDIRKPPSDSDYNLHWHWARTIDDAKLIMNTVEIVSASLDHDLGLDGYDPDEPDADLRRVPAQYRCYHCPAITFERGLNIAPNHCTGCRADSGALSKIEVPDGVEFAEWLVEVGRVPRIVVLHSMNPVGAENMKKVLEGHAETLIIRPYQRW